MTFRLSFYGRQVGAIGIFGMHCVTVEAESEEAARLKLYETHEHISACGVERVPDRG